MYLGEYAIDEYVDLVATSHRFSSGAAYDATSITYRVYENGSATEMISDTAMTKFDSETGFYFDRIQCTAALGYENGKSYVVLIKATIDGVACIDWRSFKVKAASVAQTGDAYAIVSNGTYGNSAIKTQLADIHDTDLPAVKADTAAVLLDTGTDGVVVVAGSKTGYALTSTEHTSIADALLKRDWTSVTGEAARSVLNALRFLRNKWSLSGTTLTVTKEDDSTSAWTGTVTSSESANPITGNDPS
jgi:hypothetical protein